MKLILMHSNADFDAVAAALAAHKLDPDAIPLLPQRLNHNVEHFLMLYRNGMPFMTEAELKPHDVSGITLVDTQRLPRHDWLPKKTPLEIIDHHEPYSRDDLQPHEHFLSEAVGATTTILIERIQQQGLTISPLEATLMALGIYEDTGSLMYGTTTARDIRAAAWLLEQHAALDTVRRFLAPPLNEAQQSLFDLLMDQSETRSVQGHQVTLAHARVDEHVSEVSSVVHRLRDILDATGIFVLVQMPKNLLLICRSSADAIDCGAVARHFGGGGHTRAAAATIYDQRLDSAIPKLWAQIQAHTQPLALVENLMSFGVQTVDSQQSAEQVAQQVRKIGHEGYPVLNQGRVVGLLTRRELDRALAHDLHGIKVGDIMQAGEISLRPDDSVHQLERKMVDSGWGQIPVIDAHDKLIGIVTRTDLIKYWASVHPPQASAQPSVSDEQLREVLGEAVAELLHKLATVAQQRDLTLYMVGGAVRDLLLERPNLDLDFVIEGSAIEFVQVLVKRYGGESHSFPPFGTAKWLLKDDGLPEHIDLASSRNEYYTHPSALPTVYQGSIKLDLQRRDFTINTLTVQLSPEAVKGRVLDFYGGLADLQAGLIRVLHSLSFVDDPTRILRAIRFEHRLGFTIEPRTAELMSSALPILSRVTGERLRNELTLLLSEEEPETALRRMDSLGILTAIHPTFVITPALEEQFRHARQLEPPWEIDYRLTDLYWHILATAIATESVSEFCEALLIGRHTEESMRAAARLVQAKLDITSPALRPSQIVARLEGIPEIALLCAWLLGDTLQRQQIEAYVQTWRDLQPATTGHDLKALGLTPGPCYSAILSRLRRAWLDGEIKSQAEELMLRERLIEAEDLCRDHA